MADDRDFAAYYDRAEEEGRLGDWGRLEFLRTRELLARFLPAPPATVLDVGGAAGVYHLTDAADRTRARLRRRHEEPGRPRPDRRRRRTRRRGPLHAGVHGAEVRPREDLRRVAQPRPSDRAHRALWLGQTLAASEVLGVGLVVVASAGVVATRP